RLNEHKRRLCLICQQFVPTKQARNLTTILDQEITCPCAEHQQDGLVHIGVARNPNDWIVHVLFNRLIQRDTLGNDVVPQSHIRHIAQYFPTLFDKNTAGLICCHQMSHFMDWRVRGACIYFSGDYGSNPLGEKLVPTNKIIVYRNTLSHKMRILIIDDLPAVFSRKVLKKWLISITKGPKGLSRKRIYHCAFRR